MLVNALEYLCLIYFSVKKLLGGFFVWFWQKSYDWGNQRFSQMTNECIPFLNYGYKEGANPDNKEIDDAILKHRDRLKENLPIAYQKIWCSTQLYTAILTRCPQPLDKKFILEVGCGRGGGSSVVRAYCDPKRYVGIDISPEAISHCRLSHRNERDMDFSVADAMELPKTFPENCFDAIINCESAHCYPDFEKFIRGVMFCLKPGGHFMIADLNAKVEWTHLRSTFEKCGMEILSEHDITNNVTKSLRDEVQPVLQDIIWKAGAWWESPWLWLVNNTMVVAPKNCLEDGTLEYRLFCCRKPVRNDPQVLRS